MADKPMKEGERDVELEKAQKGYANYEKQQQEAQKKIDSEDAAVKTKVKEAVTKVKSVFGLKAGGSVSSASKRADGCAVKGKTRGRMV